MTRAVVDDAVQEQDLLRLREPVRAYLARTVHDEQELDDLVQETLLRVWEVRRRVERGAAASYAVATARNLVSSRERAQQVHRRHAHRLHAPPTVDGPEVHALQREEQVAAAQVLDTLRSDDRRLLAADDEAAGRERTARRRSSLARARSRARVDYLLRLRRLELPTDRCRPVLEALSAGDRRQQDRVGAAQHLLTCPVCAACAKPLLTRERRMFGVVALPALVLLEPLRRAWSRSPGATSAGAAAVALAAVTGIVLAQGGDPPEVRAAPPVPAVAVAAPPFLLEGDAGFGPSLGQRAGQPVVARGVTVRAVVSDEGFWVGPDDARRVFVRLATGGESPVDVTAGQRVGFTGTVRPVTADVTAGVTADEGLVQLQAQGAYLDVAASGVSVVPG